MAGMKRPSASLLVLIAAVIALAVAVSVSMYRTDTAHPPGWGKSIPGWGAAVRPGPLSNAHAFIGNQCASCHKPNEGITVTKCVTCHVPAKELLSRPSTVFHSDVKTCSGCHVEHQGRDKRPIKMDHAVLERLAMREAGKPVALDCKGCHVFKDKHQEFFGPKCATCHATDTWKIVGFLHPSPKNKECSQCHKPPPSHLMMHFNMMDKSITGQRNATVNQCYACHQTDSWNNIKGVGKVDMH
jgi:hypothetical protein